MFQIKTKTPCLFLTILFSISFSNYCQPQNVESLLWKISGKKLEAPSYLFGTIHAICKDDFFLPDSFIQCLEKSDVLVLEIDMDDPFALLNMQKSLTMKDGQTLSNLLGDSIYSEVELFFMDSLGTELIYFENYKPLFLTGLFVEKIMKCQIETYELKLLSEAKSLNMKIVGIETVEEQFDIIDKIPYDRQAEILLNSINDFPETKMILDSLINVYKRQNITELLWLIKESEKEMKEFGDILLIDRNKKWIPKIEAIIKVQPSMIAVGAGHLPGEYGLINLLIENGYVLTPVK